MISDQGIEPTLGVVCGTEIMKSIREGDIANFIGMFRGQASRPVGIEEMNEAIAAG
ncbi:MAG: hypothetical protein LBU11_09215 [Zoogloeaceae bacterium]|jgi:hypothetical protein|nr:hypothetical protein [Zoogloeaceae bacterium]